MKVCKKVRLLQKTEKGLYKKDGQIEVLRNRAIVSEQSVKESEANCEDTGLLWVIDVEATKERDASLNPKAKKETKKED